MRDAHSFIGCLVDSFFSSGPMNALERDLRWYIRFFPCLLSLHKHEGWKWFWKSRGLE